MIYGVEIKKVGRAYFASTRNEAFEKVAVTVDDRTKDFTEEGWFNIHAQDVKYYEDTKPKKLVISGFYTLHPTGETV